MKIQATTFKRFCFTGLLLTTAAALVFTGASRLHDWVQISPVAAQVTTVNPWTAIGASGVADETDFAPMPLFAFTNASGSDVVQDFQNGTDKLSISGFGTSLDTAAEIISHATQVGADVHITLPNQGATGSTVITLHNFTLANLDASDLIITA